MLLHLSAPQGYTTGIRILVGVLVGRVLGIAVIAEIAEIAEIAGTIAGIAGTIAGTSAGTIAGIAIAGIAIAGIAIAGTIAGIDDKLVKDTIVCK